jgi:carboxyl-terminal processing protease
MAPPDVRRGDMGFPQMVWIEGGGWMRMWVGRRRWAGLFLAVILAAGTAAAARPAEAADGSLVVAALEVLQQNYVDPVDSVERLNVAIEALREATHQDADALPSIPPGATLRDAEAAFVAEFNRATPGASASQIAYAVTQAMLASLHDSHTYFVPPPQFQERRRELVGGPGITGIGIRIAARKDSNGAAWIFVEDVLPESPADKAGIKRFDRILQAGETSLQNVTAGEASSAIRGPAGSTVDLVLQRGEQVVRVAVVRDPIPPVPAYARFIEPGVVYARLYLFARGAGRALGVALESLAAEGPVRSIILDLRENPGGLVGEAVRVGGLFLPPNTSLASVVDRVDGTSTLRTLGRPLFPDTPLVILVDGQSASASEMIAGVLKELGRATIVGERTAGALGGAIEVALPEGGMSVTVERIKTPGGVEIENVGVGPDAPVALTVADMVRGDDTQLQEALRAAHTEVLQNVP